MTIHIKDLPAGSPAEASKNSAELTKQYGSTLNFQIYRLSPEGTTVDAYQGPRLADVSTPSGWVSGGDTVAEVAERLREALGSRVRDGERVTFWFNGRRMKVDGLFYADHYMMLPVFVQVLLHTGEPEAIDDAIARFKQTK